MYYGYDICPKCKDRLITRPHSEKNEDDFERISKRHCTKCGNVLMLACVGEKQIDDTIYTIVLEDAVNYKRKDVGCIETIMKVGNCDFQTAVDKLSTANSILFQGDFFHTFMNMELLDRICMVYTITPKIPFSRYLYSDACPQCGNKVFESTKEIENSTNYVLHGLFCEHCKDWVMVTSINKMNLDDTIYNLSFSLSRMNCQEREEVFSIINELSNKEIINDIVIVYDEAYAIYEILQRLKKSGIGYEVLPSFPYEIESIEEADEEFILSILETIKEDYCKK